MREVSMTGNYVQLPHNCHFHNIDCNSSSNFGRKLTEIHWPFGGDPFWLHRQFFIHSLHWKRELKSSSSWVEIMLCTLDFNLARLVQRLYAVMESCDQSCCAKNSNPHCLLSRRDASPVPQQWCLIAVRNIPSSRVSAGRSLRRGHYIYCVRNSAVGARGRHPTRKARTRLQDRSGAGVSQQNILQHLSSQFFRWSPLAFFRYCSTLHACHTCAYYRQNLSNVIRQTAQHH